MKGTIVAQITHIGQAADFSKTEKPFYVREFLLKTIEEFPIHYKVQFTQDKVSLLDGYVEGQTVKVKCQLKGREYTKKGKGVDVFMSLNAWEIETA